MKTKFPYYAIGALGAVLTITMFWQATAEDFPPKKMPLQTSPLSPTPPGVGRIIDFAGRAPRAHDPVMAKEADTYYLFSTGRGIVMQSSKDMVTWERRGSVFKEGLKWAQDAIPGVRDFYWAPDISFFNGKWHLYYSASTFGSNRSAIGVATNVTLNPDDPNYRWEDQGSVIESHRNDNWNAIDPNVAFDSDGQPWLSFGSFWSGIKLRKLNLATGKLAVEDQQLYSLASRPRDQEPSGAIEGPFIIRRGDFYYLFVSFDLCCRGVNSTYNIRVGRSKQIVGPYVGRFGKAMTEGGGTPVLAGSTRWRGPGHNSIYREGEKDWLVYHAYDAEDNGAAKLHIEELVWDADGWPHAPSASQSDTAQ